MKQHRNPPLGPSPPTTHGHPMPRTFLSDREHDTGPLHPCPCGVPQLINAPQTVLAGGPSFVPGPAFPRLVSPANTPSSLREQQPGGLGDGTGVWCYLKQYSWAPSLAPWSPADPTILPLWPEEEREGPAWSRSHPLLIENLSLLVMDVNNTIRRRCFFKLIKEQSEPSESIQQGAHSPRRRCQGTEPCPKAPGCGTYAKRAEGTHQKELILFLL
ncbi:hypothetical protein NQZ68_026551 [Dissostichus eleginoides]|nr:hypothetical protein NQZ68_026551 [Dissostichus eleginoides]